MRDRRRPPGPRGDRRGAPRNPGPAGHHGGGRPPGSRRPRTSPRPSASSATIGHRHAHRSHRPDRRAERVAHLVGMRRTHLAAQEARELLLVELLVATDQREHRTGRPYVEQALDRLSRLDPEQTAHLGDGPHSGGRDLAVVRVDGTRRRRLRPRELHVGRIAARRAARDLVLPGRARSHELVRAGAAHHPDVRLHHVERHPRPTEDPLVRFLLLLVRDVEASIVDIQRVRVLHPELSRPQDSRARSRLVALLRLDLVPDLRQLTVGPDFLRREPRDDLLVGHSEAHVTAVPVLEPEHLVLDVVPAARLLPELRGMEHRHRDLLTADPVHLVPDDRVDLVDGSLAEREVHVDPGGQLPYQTGADHQPVADRLGVGGILAESRDE